MTQQLVRYVVAIIVATVIGQIVQILAAIFIDFIVGHEGSSKSAVQAQAEKILQEVEELWFRAAIIFQC